MKPFVGRDRQLADLRARLGSLSSGDAASGGGGVVLLHGPAGIGKTRLADEALSAVAPGCAVGRGYCAAEASPPLWPWRRALRSAAVRAAPAAAEALAEAERVLPGGSTGSPTGSPTGSSTGGRTGEGSTPDAAPDAATVSSIRMRALADAADALVAAALRAPLVLLLEDLHWADRGSLALLTELAGQVSGTPLLVIGTHRELPAGLAEVTASLHRHASVEVVSLPVLAEADVRRYLDRVQLPELSAARVAARCGGLPLLLEAATSDARHGVAAEQVPIQAAAAAAGLISPLTPVHRAAMEAAAVIGPLLDEALTAQVAGVDRDAVSAAAQAALRAGLLVRQNGGSGGRYRFAHELWRDAVSASIPDTRRQELHRLVARALSAPGVGLGADPSARTSGLAAVIAAHWRAAGDGADTLRELAIWSHRAADDALTALAPADAAVQLEVAADALERAGAPVVDQAVAHLDVARARYLAGSYPAALEECERAGRLAESAGRADLAAEAALVVQGVTFTRAGVILTTLSETALRLADGDGGTLDDTLRSRLHAQLAVMAADAGQVDHARDQAARAMELARASADAQALLDAVRAREMTLNDADDVTERLELGALAVEQADRLGRPLNAIIGYSWRFSVGYLLARREVVDDAQHHLWAIAERTRLPLARWHALRATASRAVLEGRFDDAREANAQAYELALVSGDLTAAGMTGAHRHHVAVVRGDPREFGDDDLAELGTAPPMPLITAARGVLLLMTGRREEARAEYEQVVAHLHRAVRDPRWGGLLLLATELVVAFAGADTAALLAAHLEPWARHPGAAGTSTAYLHGNPTRQYGLALGLAGRTGEARAALATAVERNVALGARPHVVLARLDLAELILRSADGEVAQVAQAADLARDAAAEARRLDMPGPLARADALLVRARSAARRADPLSRREREVVDLVVRAMSNREIADRLVLSERTVESHVRSILAKLGCANRTELVLRRGGEPSDAEPPGAEPPGAASPVPIRGPAAQREA